MVVTLYSEAYVDWMEDVVESLTEQLCDAFPELSAEGVMHALYGVYTEMIIRGEMLRFDEVLLRGIDGGERGLPVMDWAGTEVEQDPLARQREREALHLAIQREREAIRLYSELTSPLVVQRFQELVGLNGTCQLQVLELHRALDLPPESDHWLRLMFPGGHSLESLAEIEENIHQHGYSTDIPF